LIADGDTDDQDQHGRDPARERVDDAHVRPRVGRDQERDVCELEERRRDEVGNCRTVHLPEDQRDGRADDRADDDRHRRGGLRVVEAGEQQVPGRMQHRR
jgi:hypothetical protein